MAALLPIAGALRPEWLRQPQIDRVQLCRFPTRCYVLGAQARQWVARNVDWFFLCRRRFPDASTAKAKCRRGASHGTPGRGGWAHQKGRDVERLHGLYFFAEPNRLGNWLDVEFFLSEAPRMDQREFPLLARVKAPSAAPEQWIRHAKTYRQAVRLAWKFRRDEAMTRQQLATEAQLYPQHVTDYLHEDDKPSRRDLPADAVARFEEVVGNSIVSQWLAARSQLTVLEELQATRAVA